MIKWKVVLMTVLAGAVGLAIGFKGLEAVPQIDLPEGHVINRIAGIHRPKILGFLPYWLLDEASGDYTKTMTDIGYFGIIVDGDGSIVKANENKEAEPGWNALDGEKLKQFRAKNRTKYSLLIQSGVEDSITKLISKPEDNAKKMMSEVVPLLKQYGFTELNLDIESMRTGSDEDRANFTTFVKTVRAEMNANELGQLVIELPVAAFTKKTIMDAAALQPYIDYAVVMAYDYHYRGSLNAGPVAPLKGSGEVREIDVSMAMDAALKSFRSEQLIMGIPLYGYEWETINDQKEAAVIPGSGRTASLQRVEELLKSCTTCKVSTEELSGEKQVTFTDEKFGSVHQIYVPSEKSLEQKVEMVKEKRLGGVAFWALGYEDQTTLQQLGDFKSYYYWKD